MLAPPEAELTRSATSSEEGYAGDVDDEAGAAVVRAARSIDDNDADLDDDASADGSISPRRRRRRNKGRWKRMFVPNIVQKKLDFVAQTKKKMAKMQDNMVSTVPTV